MNRSYSKIRHIKEANMRIEQKFLNEGQSVINGGKVGRLDEAFIPIPKEPREVIADKLLKKIIDKNIYFIHNLLHKLRYEKFYLKSKKSIIKKIIDFSGSGKYSLVTYSDLLRDLIQVAPYYKSSIDPILTDIKSVMEDLNKFDYSDNSNVYIATVTLYNLFERIDAKFDFFFNSPRKKSSTLDRPHRSHRSYRSYGSHTNSGKKMMTMMTLNSLLLIQIFLVVVALVAVVLVAGTLVAAVLTVVVLAVEVQVVIGKKYFKKYLDF